MKLVESSDGTIKVVELDPTKKHIVVMDFDCGLDPQQIQMRDGAIWMVRPRSRIEFVEADTLPSRDDLRLKEAV